MDKIIEVDGPDEEGMLSRAVQSRRAAELCGIVMPLQPHELTIGSFAADHGIGRTAARGHLNNLVERGLATRARRRDPETGGYTWGYTLI